MAMSDDQCGYCGRDKDVITLKCRRCGMQLTVCPRHKDLDFVAPDLCRDCWDGEEELKPWE